MKSKLQRLNNISGQIDGIKKMMEGDCDCEKVLIQLKAIKAGIGGIMNELIEEQFSKDKELLIKFKKYVATN